MPPAPARALYTRRFPAQPRRQGLRYSAEEKAAMLAVRESCKESGKNWSAEMDKLAAKFERAPEAVKSKCKEWEWKEWMERWKASQR
jgi:hypothetical protein